MSRHRIGAGDWTMDAGGYWTPQNRWMYYNNGNWVTYNANGPNVR